MSHRENIDIASISQRSMIASQQLAALEQSLKQFFGEVPPLTLWPGDALQKRHDILMSAPTNAELRCVAKAKVAARLQARRFRLQAESNHDAR